MGCHLGGTGWVSSWWHGCRCSCGTWSPSLVAAAAAAAVTMVVEAGRCCWALWWWRWRVGAPQATQLLWWCARHAWCPVAVQILTAATHQGVPPAPPPLPPPAAAAGAAWCISRVWQCCTCPSQTRPWVQQTTWPPLAHPPYHLHNSHHQHQRQTPPQALAAGVPRQLALRWRRWQTCCCPPRWRCAWCGMRRAMPWPHCAPAGTWQQQQQQQVHFWTPHRPQ